MTQASTAAGAQERLLAWRQVKDITGLSRTTAWRLQKVGDFPAPVVISPGRVGWREGEVAAWAASRARRSPCAAQPPTPSVPPPRPRPIEPPSAAAAAQRPSEPRRVAPPVPRRQAHKRRSNSRAPGQLDFNF
ncbi:MAG: AlpA family phage regulatory protein [Phenylobacterium sp.]|uniref:helix-turn-helix transcriptional regulator n=1 Tax=Phenylobacterium sp. TaxID=1871053 RepID=UPI00344FD76E|nr:AlpA family phage regulatory protein [Phenylobacterium sp.]